MSYLDKCDCGTIDCLVGRAHVYIPHDVTHQPSDITTLFKCVLIVEFQVPSLLNPKKENGENFREFSHNICSVTELFIIIIISQNDTLFNLSKMLAHYDFFDNSINEINFDN